MSDKPELKRSPAQFFFEVGYGAAYAEALIRNDMKPPFEYSDALVEHAWSIAGEAHDDPAEFDAMLAQANAGRPTPPEGTATEDAAREVLAKVLVAHGEPGDAGLVRNGDLEDAEITGEQAVEAMLTFARSLQSPATVAGDMVLVPHAGVRREVAAFALLMERQLRANDHKPGWKNDSPVALARRVNQEADELWEVVNEMDPGRAQAGDPPVHDREELSLRAGLEAADVANMAMMVADVCGALSASRPASEAGGEG